MRVAIAGLGAAAVRGHLPALAALAREREVTLVGGCDPDPERLRFTRRAFPELPLFASAAEMLSSVRADLLVIAADPRAHGELARLGALHEQHILCEKPACVTRAQLSELTAIKRRNPDRGLVGVYQYRFSRTWVTALRFARAALQSGRVAMSVDIRRVGTDPYASSRWRSDLRAGGALGDHAVHFLALARMIAAPMNVASAVRRWDNKGRETVETKLYGSGIRLNVFVSYGAIDRSTHVTLTSGEATLQWKDHVLSLARRRSEPHCHAVPSLSDRRYVDSLYLPMYRDLLPGLTRSAWRQDRARELLGTGRTLLSLLDAARRTEIDEASGVPLTVAA